MPSSRSLVINGCAIVTYSSSALWAVERTDCVLKIAAIVLLILNLPIGFKKSQKSIPMHANLKLLLANTAITYFLHATSYIVQHLIREIKQTAAVDGCVAPWIFWQCLVLRGVRFATTLGFTATHCAFLVERTVATIRPASYENANAALSWLLTLTMWSILAIWTYFVLSDEDPTVLASDCTFALETAERMTWSLYVCVAIDVFVSFGDLVLVIANRKQRAKIDPEYSLRLSYQLKENNVTTKIIFPCSVVHSVAYGIYLLLNSVVYSLIFGNFSPSAAVLLEGTQMALSAYMCISLAFFYYVRRNISLQVFNTQQPVPVDDYFAQFQQQIAYRPKIQIRAV